MILKCIDNSGVEMGILGPARGPKRTGSGLKIQAPRALRVETGLMLFYLRFLCALCAGRWVVTSKLVTRELCIVVTCKCVVY